MSAVILDPAHGQRSNTPGQPEKRSSISKKTGNNTENNIEIWHDRMSHCTKSCFRSRQARLESMGSGMGTKEVPGTAFCGGKHIEISCCRSLYALVFDIIRQGGI